MRSHRARIALALRSHKLLTKLILSSVFIFVNLNYLYIDIDRLKK